MAHFGLINETDILSTLAAIELLLVEFGKPVIFGSAVAAASPILQGMAEE
jgi:aspartate aminotransferase-like enzyme